MNEDGGPDRDERREGLPARPAVVGGALLVLLALVALASNRGVTGGGGEGRERAPDAFFDYVFTAAVLVAIACAVLLVAVLSQIRVHRRGKPDEQRGFLQIVLMFAVLTAVGTYAFRHVDLDRRGADEGGELGLPRVEPTKVQDPAQRSVQPRFRWELAAAVGGLAGLGALAYLARGRTREAPTAAEDEPELAESLSDVLSDTLDDLRRERDARRAVIAAYARLERTLAARGVPRRPHEAPLEYLSRVLLQLEVSPGAVLDLTELFEQAKFSRRSIDAEMKEEAIAALAAVRDDLRVAA